MDLNRELAELAARAAADPDFAARLADSNIDLNAVMTADDAAKRAAIMAARLMT